MTASARSTTSPAGPRQARVYGVAAAVSIAVAALCWLAVAWLEDGAPLVRPGIAAGALLFVVFGLGELFPLRFEVRAEQLLVSVSEFPLVLGVLLLPSWQVVTLYMVAAAVAFAVRRAAAVAAALNLALIAVETGVAFVVVAALGPVSSARPIATAADLLDAAQARMLPVALGVVAGATASAGAVALMRRASGVRERELRVIGRSALIAVLVVGLTLTGFTVWTALAVGPILCLTLVAAAGLLYRSYFVFLRQHLGLAGLYAFGASVSSAGVDLDSWQRLAAEIRQHLAARAAVLHLVDWPSGPVALAAGEDGPLRVAPLGPDEPILARARRTGAALSSARRERGTAMGRAMSAVRATDVMVAALDAGGRQRGYVYVWDCRPRWRRLGADDLQLLRTMAGHLATALDNHRLVTRLQHAAFHDPVTGLVNRSGMAARSDEQSVHGARPGVLLLEFDVLGDVTGALGHDHGDQLLVTMSRRLVAAAGPGRVVARIDADRFAILLDPGDRDRARAIAERLLAVADEPIEVDGVEIESNAVVGIAFADPSAAPAGSSTGPTRWRPAHTTDAAGGPTGDAGAVRLGSPQDELLQQAQLALAAARSKDERVAVYRPAIGEVYHRRFRLVSQFRHAVDAGQISVYYQPKATLLERELIGVEALVRWQHPEYGFVSPAELIEAIEPTSAIDVLFAHVLDRALVQIADWLARGMRIAVAVNLSVRNLLAPDLVRTIESGLTAHAVPSELLTLEVTESSIMNQPERSLPILRHLHAMGIRLSMDDFGTGYSSLAYLRRLPIDELKIDKSFVQGMVTDLGDLAIVRAIIDLGHSLGMRVVAEGVEEEAGRDALQSMRCDAIQGFLLSRPQPIDRFESWLASRTLGGYDDPARRPALLRLRM